MAKKIYLSVLFLGIFVVSVYYFLGGFKEVSLQDQENISLNVAGKYFYGKYDDRSLERLFKSAKRLILSDSVKGNLCVIAYQSDTLTEEYVYQFVGVTYQPETDLIPADLEKKEFFGEAISIKLDMHPLAMPNPVDIQTILSEAAVKKGWKLPDYFLEIYNKDNSTIIYTIK